MQHKGVVVALHPLGLAQSLAVEIMVLQRQTETMTLICERLQEMANVVLAVWTKLPPILPLRGGAVIGALYGLLQGIETL